MVVGDDICPCRNAPLTQGYLYLRSWQDLYVAKREEVDVKSQRVTVGLEKLKKGAADVETMKVRT